MYLLDTDVLSRLAPARGDDAPVVREWIVRNGGLCFLSAVSIAEISYGVHRLLHRGATRRAADLKTWVDAVPARFPGRIIPVDERVAVRAGELLARAEAAGVEPGMEDALVAAAADTRGMIVLTRNLRHFLPMAVAAIDPFEALPDTFGLPGGL
jgi:predicted nucleic acid-binding protein